MGRPQWENGPFKLIPTPIYEKGLTRYNADQYTEVASLMAVVHNVIIRGLNTIYLQAPSIKEKDLKDFVGYCLCWADIMEEHHDMEEERFFPWIEDAAGEKGLMNANIEQHKQFHDGIVEYKTYFASLSGEESSFSAAKVLSIIDAFGPVLSQHMADEIVSLLGLSKYGDKIPLRHFWAKMRKGKMSLKAAGKIPFFFLNLDRSFEDGLWEDWPPAPRAVKWVICHMLSYLNSGYWKFTACGTDMMPQALYAHKEGNDKHKGGFE